MTLAVLINEAAGRVVGAHAEVSRHVARVLTALNLDASIELLPPTRLEAAALRAASAPNTHAVVAVGGDGTVSSVARALVGTSVPLGVLPLGTLNHFARDLGLPSGLEASAAIVARGRVAEVDVAEVNGRIFLNNAVMGPWAELVAWRDRHGWRRRAGKWWAMALGARHALSARESFSVRLPDGPPYAHDSPFVFVGNNRYDLVLPGAPGRSRLDRGELQVWTADRPKVLYRPVSVIAPEVEVTATDEVLRVALDGEVQVVTGPLHFRSRPRALRAITPG